MSAHLKIKDKQDRLKQRNEFVDIFPPWDPRLHEKYKENNNNDNIKSIIK